VSAALLALGAGAAWLGAPALGLALAGGAVANALFFRNPRRIAPPGERRVLSPADGRIAEVASDEDPERFVPGPCVRIAVFLSVLDVHVNRVPLSGTVRRIARRGTHFLAAFRADAAQRNVQSRIDLESAEGLRVAFVQIAGLIARRIVCYAREGDRLERGEPYGLICYGSRMELYLPARSAVLVRPGQRVRAGETAVAELEP
jgi:phosphatidylserine decarboxylase